MIKPVLSVIGNLPEGTVFVSPITNNPCLLIKWHRERLVNYYIDLTNNLMYTFKENDKEYISYSDTVLSLGQLLSNLPVVLKNIYQ